MTSEIEARVHSRVRETEQEQRNGMGWSEEMQTEVVTQYCSLSEFFSTIDRYTIQRADEDDLQTTEKILKL